MANYFYDYRVTIPSHELAPKVFMVDGGIFEKVKIDVLPSAEDIIKTQQAFEKCFNARVKIQVYKNGIFTSFGNFYKLWEFLQALGIFKTL